uniref:Helicase C-terminal domain-containing protein n=1 Tax=Fibrocapsa japonica TaxID=94617 RepID=A0A7S2US85_9STRA
MAVLSAVAKAADILKPQTALVFICGEFGKKIVKQKVATPRKAAKTAKSKKQSYAKRKGLFQNKKAVAEVKDNSISARQACKTLGQLGIKAMPLHVVLGLELNAKEDDEDAEVPPFLVTFEGSARGLHFDNIDVVFVIGRPASAASYLHLAGRVGRASTVDGKVVIRPGTVVSLCTKGSATELNKWTKQVGGTDLEELIL